MRRSVMARKLAEALNAASIDADARKRYADQLAECRRELAQTRKPQVFVSGKPHEATTLDIVSVERNDYGRVEVRGWATGNLATGAYLIVLAPTEEA